MLKAHQDEIEWDSISRALHWCHSIGAIEKYDPKQILKSFKTINTYAKQSVGDVRQFKTIQSIDVRNETNKSNIRTIIPMKSSSLSLK